MATKAAEHRTADPPIRVPAEHQTAAAAADDDDDDGCSEKRKEREVEEEEGEKEIRSRELKRRRCQLALDKESKGSSFSFDTRCAVPIETTPKFGSFNSSAAADPGEGERSSGDAAAGEEEESGARRELGGRSGEGKDGI